MTPLELADEDPDPIPGSRAPSRPSVTFTAPPAGSCLGLLCLAGCGTAAAAGAASTPAEQLRAVLGAAALSKGNIILPAAQRTVPSEPGSCALPAALSEAPELAGCWQLPACSPEPP